MGMALDWDGGEVRMALRSALVYVPGMACHPASSFVAMGLCDGVTAILTPRLGAARHRGLELRLPTPSLPPLLESKAEGVPGIFPAHRRETRTSALGIAGGRLSTIR